MSRASSADLLRHGRGEEQGLTLARHVPEDLPDVRQEALVEHAVRLVDDERLDAAELDEPLSDQIEQPAGRRDDDVDAVAERARLRVLADAAEDDRGPQRAAATVGVEAVVDLRRELARRRDHEHARGAPARASIEALEDGQRERCGLAGARLRASEQVAPCEHVRDGLDLDGRRHLVARLVNRGERGRGERQILKPGVTNWSVRTLGRNR